MKVFLTASLAALMLVLGDLAVAERRTFGIWTAIIKTDAFTQERECKSVAGGAQGGETFLVLMPKLKGMSLHTRGRFVTTVKNGINNHRVKFDDGPIMDVTFHAEYDYYVTFDIRILPNLKKSNKILLEGDFTSGQYVHSFSLDGFTEALEYCMKKGVM